MRLPLEAAAEMMKPYAGQVDAWKVGADVGSVKNNRPELMDRVGLAYETDGGLSFDLSRATPMRTGHAGLRCSTGIS